MKRVPVLLVVALSMLLLYRSGGYLVLDILSFALLWSICPIMQWG